MTEYVKKSVLITAIGSMSAITVITRLKELGYRTVGCDYNPKNWIANSSVVDKFIQVAKTMDNRYIEQIESICKEDKISYIVPLTDVEVDILNHNRSIFEKMDVKLCMSDFHAIKLCRNKYALYSKLIENKVCNLIPTFTLDSLRKGNIDFPIICKPKNGRSSQGMIELKDKRELNCFISCVDGRDYIVQPKVEGTVVTVDIIRTSVQKTRCISVSRRELIRTSNGAGVSVGIFTDKLLKKQCEEIADIINVCGCVNFEFIEKNGKFYFLECNPRFSAGIVFSMMAGYDFIANHMRCFMNEEIETEKEIAEIHIARRYCEYCMD